MTFSGQPTLGIDIGTQGVRAVVLAADGAVLGAGAAPLAPGHRSGSHHEQDPENWWDALCVATRHALSALSGVELGALAIDGTSGTILVQGADTRARSVGLMYDDARAAQQAQRAQLVGESLWRAQGLTIQNSWALPRAMWLVQQGTLQPGDRIVHQSDHLASRLAGRLTATDSSSALKSGVDLQQLCWPEAIFEDLQLSPALFPVVVLPGTEIGRVCRRAADETGIPLGTTIRAGMTDGCAAQIAARALTPGSWSSAMGTTLVLKGATAELLVDPSGALYSHRSPDGGWLPGGASSTGAGIIARDFEAADLGELTELAAAFDPAPGVTYPLAGTGERFPFLAPQAVGFAEGVPDQPGAKFASILQGIAFVEKLAYETISALGGDISGPVTLSGGSTKNAYWNQLRSDLLGREVLIPSSVEAAVGMAILAAAEPGQVGATAEKMVAIERTYEPNAVRGGAYEDSYRNFLAGLASRGYLTGAP